MANSYDLPDDVFQAGEVRPTRPKKKVIKKVEQTVAQKRNIDAVDGQELSDSAPKRHVSQNGMVTQATPA
ncbi:polynucleotide adenylyltransferase [Microsporum ferrugineum]